MKNKFNIIKDNIKTKRSIHYILIIIIGLLVSIPLIKMQIASTDDGRFHLLRLIGLDNAFKYSSFPFLVFPFFCNNWGYSMTSFYPPIVTYIPYALSFFTNNFANALKLFAMFTTILSGIFMYNFVNEISKKKFIAIFSAIVYITFPYRLEDIYNRYAIGEFTAFIFMPIVFQGLYNLLNGNKKRHYYIAIGATGLILTHTISTVYTALFCVIYILCNIRKFNNKDVITKCTINAVFIILMSLMFIIPMFEFKSQAEYSIFNSDIMRTNSESVAKKAISPIQFLRDIEEENGVSFVLGIPFVIMLLTGILIYKNLDKKYRKIYNIGLILGIVSLFMCTKYFPWKYMPQVLCSLQYSWRLLGFAIVFLAPICATNIYYLLNLIKKEKIRNLTVMLIIILLSICTYKELIVYEIEYKIQDTEYETKNINNPKIHYFSINRDYLPTKSLLEQNKYLYKRTDETYVLSGNAKILNEEKQALHLELELQNVENNTIIELPFLFYPGYTIKLQTDNEEYELKYEESEYGFIKIVIPNEIYEGKIIVDYTATMLDKASYILSAASLILFICYIIYFRSKSKKEEENEKQN